MRLLIPLGLLGLLTIIALIVIYVIKPNYQHKEVTSTYVWKLSMKYRKKRLPTSKLRNILLIVCQVLALIAGALIMSKPAVFDDEKVFNAETVAIIDASASMRARDDRGVTRFERAVEQAIDLANFTVKNGGYFSLILSDGNDSFVVQEAGLLALEEVEDKLNALIDEEGDLACSYGSTNLDTAITMCEDLIKSNPSASIYLYTDTDYAYVPEGMHLVNVADEAEWNVGILKAYTEFEEGYYTFFVELGCYGAVARTVTLDIDINGASVDTDSMNDAYKSVFYTTEVTLGDNSTTTVIFRNSAIKEADYESSAENVVIVPVGSDVIGQYNKERVVSYDDVCVSIDDEDSLDSDNTYSIYGGRKQQLKIQYATYKKKPFFTGLFAALRKNYADRWELKIDEVEMGYQVPETKGYDLYIYDDGANGAALPTDGVVVVFNPCLFMPAGLTKRTEVSSSNEMYAAEVNDHAILKNVDASKFYVRNYIRLSGYDESRFKVLWSVNEDPLLLIEDNDYTKVIVGLFDTQHSNATMVFDQWAFLWNNIFNTFLPATVRARSFEVGERISVSSRGKRLTVSDSYGTEETVITDLPSYIRLDKPGTYRFSQTNYFGKILPDDYIFVQMPDAESNIFATGISLKPVYLDKSEEDQPYQDLLVYLAAAMLALLFTEWFLQTHEAV